MNVVFVQLTHSELLHFSLPWNVLQENIVKSARTQKWLWVVYNLGGFHWGAKWTAADGLDKYWGSCASSLVKKKITAKYTEDEMANPEQGCGSFNPLNHVFRYKDQRFVFWQQQETTEACKVRMENSTLASALLGEAGELHPLDNLAQPIMISSPASHCKANDTTRLLKPASWALPLLPSPTASFHSLCCLSGRFLELSKNNIDKKCNELLLRRQHLVCAGGGSGEGGDGVDGWWQCGPDLNSWDSPPLQDKEEKKEKKRFLWQ